MVFVVLGSYALKRGATRVPGHGLRRGAAGVRVHHQRRARARSARRVRASRAVIPALIGPETLRRARWYYVYTRGLI